MIMVMISQITIGENRNKTARSISASSIIRNAYLLVFFFFGYSTRYLRAVAIFLLIFPCLIVAILKRKEKKTLICDINVSTTY